MRLDQITIGSAKESPTHQFKNLKNVTIDFDENEWITVVIGWNGTGKSNVLEALAIIFRDLLEGKKKPNFAYELKYHIGFGILEKEIFIYADPDDSKQTYRFEVNEKILFPLKINSYSPLTLKNLIPKRIKTIKPSFNKFTGEDSLYLPQFVFSYYSGFSKRMEEIFDSYTGKFEQSMRAGKTDIGLKRMFYAKPIHSQFVFMAFLFNQDKFVKILMNDLLGINHESGVESILFELSQPSWKAKASDGDLRFWNARGIVQEFLNNLIKLSLAPIRLKRRDNTSLWNSKTKEYLYLFLKDMNAFKCLVNGREPKLLFRDLESALVSELIEHVHIRVKLKKNNEIVTFKELSEGEQQLLTVLGLLRFTSGDESLFLLDEPDTHLNPRWSVDYLEYIRNITSQGQLISKNTSHIVLTTHNPLAIAELQKEQIQILHRNVDERQIYAKTPDIDPRGMGYAGIVTSDMFGLGSSLDSETNNKLLELHHLSIKKREDLSSTDKLRMKELREQLMLLDFNFESRDRLEQEFMRAKFDLVNDTEYVEAIVSNENKEKALKALIESLLKTEIEK